MMDTLVHLELLFLDKIQLLLASPMFDRIWIFFTHLGDYGLVWLILSLMLLAFKKTRHLGWICCLAMILGVILTNGLLKNIVGRARPFTYSDFKLLIEAPSDFSFPSGHTTASFAVAFSLYKDRFKIKGVSVYVWVMILATLVAFSRLYLYVHFPSDILAAILIAWLCASLARYLILKRINYKKSHIN